jgi:colanic acid/amylovoran biosynthesis glycosyltransferase
VPALENMSNGIRVLHVVPEFLPVTQNWIYPQITLVPGVSSAVLCQKTIPAGEFPLNGRPLWRREITVPEWLAAGPKPLRRIKRLVNLTAAALAFHHARLWKPEIIHAHFGPTGWETLSLKKAVAAPLITSFYGFDAWELPTTNPEWCEFLRQLFAEGDLFLVEGPAFRQRLVDLGCAYDKIRVQKLGVDIGSLNYRHRNFTSSFKIAMVGRFIEKKGFVDGLAACAKASASGVNLHVTIVGDDLIDAPGGTRIREQLLAIAQFPEMAGRVHFKGRLPHDETLKAMNDADILLCPSRHSKTGDAEGGLPVILIEAMALGVLCVGSRHCDIPEAVIDGTTGFLFEEGNVEQLAQLLERISRSPECLPPIVTEARRHVEQNFNQSCVLPSLGHIYGEVAARNRASLTS